MTNIGQLIRSARENKGITQTEFGKLMGWTTGQFVSNLERGMVGFPVKNRLKVAKLLNIKVDVINEALVLDYKKELNEK